MDLSSLFSAPTTAPQNGGGLFGLLGSGQQQQQNPGLAAAMGLLNGAGPHMLPAAQLPRPMPTMGGAPAAMPGFAPPIQPQIPSFAALAQLRQKLGLPTMPAFADQTGDLLYRNMMMGSL